MVNFIFKRLGYGFLVLLGVVMIVFFLFNILPGDPARMTLGQRADKATIEAITKELGLDKPLPEQFAIYINDLSPVSVHENTEKNRMKYEYTTLFHISEDKVVALKAPYLRRSYQNKKKVSEILMDALPGTVILAFTAIVFASIIGIFLGVIAAIKQHTAFDNTAVIVSVLGISTPSYFSGIILAWLFGYVLSDYTGLNMAGGLYTIDAIHGRTLELKNLILPAVALGIRPLAIIVQLTRSTMLEVLSQDYIRTAVAKGLSKNKVIFRHALRNALNPVVTAISGWFASMLAGAFFIEYIFNWKGLGKVIIDAIEKSDFPVVMGGVLFIATIFVLVNISIDIIYGMLDPRVSLKSKK